MKKIIKNILKEETDSSKLTLVKSLIHQLFDGVSFIEQSTYDNKPLLKVYFDSDDTAANIESWFSEEICDTIMEYSGNHIILCPHWRPNWDFRKKIVDFYIDAELLKYDNLGNVINEDYSPAGKEVTPNEIVVHKSNPIWRKNILETGLQVSVGECYKTYVGYGEKCTPAIFATNSTNKRAWFDSTYDDDIWFIDTKMIPDVKWYKDRHFESTKKHIVTFENIPPEALTLKYEGTGKGDEFLVKENVDDFKKNLRIINLMLTHQINWDGLCDIWVEYNKDENLYEIRSKTTKSYFEHDEIEKELEYLENTLISMGIRPYIYHPWYIKDCEDEVEFFNESKEEKNYISIIEKIVEPFKEDVGVCDIDLWYDDEDDMYSVYLVFGTEELNDKFTNDGKYLYIRKKIIAVKETIKSYLPIDNLFVGSYGKPNCGWKTLNESKEKSKKDLIERVLNDLVLPQYEHIICGFELKNVDNESLGNVINYPGVIVKMIGGEGTRMWPNTPGVQKMYDDLLDEVWETVWDYTGISLELYSKYVRDCGKEKITEKHKVSKDEYVELYRDGDFVLTIPLTHDASKKYGSDTKWCTTTKECDKKFNDHKKYGVLGYITVRDNVLKDKLENNAFALYRLYGDDNARTIVFDDENNEYRNGEEWLSNKFDRVDKLFQFYKMLQNFNSYFESKVSQKENITETDFSRDIKHHDNIQSDLIPKIQSVLNKTMSNTYDWWKGIEIYALRTSGKPFHVLTLNGVLTVDEEWGASQWKKYYDTIPFPGNDDGWEERGYKDEITLGDLTGYKDSSSENIKEDITSVINMTTNLGVSGMQLATITLVFI